MAINSANYYLKLIHINSDGSDGPEVGFTDTAWSFENAPGATLTGTATIPADFPDGTARLAVKASRKPVAVILEDKELVRLLNHFGLPTEFPAFSPAPVQYAAKRGPPDEDCQLNPLADQYDNIDPPSPED